MGWQFDFRLSGKLCTMPDSYDPDGLLLNFIKKTIRRDNYLSVGQLWELWYYSS
jgi:hypothetical protein